MDDDELRARGPAGLDPERRDALRSSVLDAIEADEALRRQGPDDLAPERRDALRTSVLAGAAASTDAPGPAAGPGEPAEDPRWAPAPAARRRGPALIRAAAVVVAVATAAAVLYLVTAGRDAEEVDTVPAAPTTVTEALDLRGIDLDLDAERVTCIASDLPDARRFDLYASATANTGAITMEAIRRICQTDIEQDPFGGGRKLGFEICRDPDVEFPQPIQLLGTGFCDSRDLVEYTSDDLAVLNAARQDEAALQLAVADLGSCPGSADVASLAATVLTRRDADLELVVADEGVADACWGVAVSWVDGTATVAPVG